ncbi:putative protein N-lysine methyltransferase METTL21D [Paratrimastix pyriformis]|uniref:Uncharacterized protein n=1 Tax=Paratrimastix pyriformis TaxID=342808 RepID=A0ABQ8UGE9_9EUKA|nr:putative protein N-lysine methyltransferase METTL21D [Paratrimastix pyriformis]
MGAGTAAQRLYRVIRPWKMNKEETSLTNLREFLHMGMRKEAEALGFCSDARRGTEIDEEEENVLGFLGLDQDDPDLPPQPKPVQPQMDPNTPDQILSDITCMGIPLKIAHSPQKGLSFQVWPACLSLCRFTDLLLRHVSPPPPPRAPLAPLLTPAFAEIFHHPTEELPPYGPAAATLLAGRHILELGAGTGLLGVALAKHGARVVITDLPKTLPVLERNIAMNGIAYPGPERAEAPDCPGWARAMAIDWFAPPALEAVSARPLDLIIASDCIYDLALHGPLIDTLVALSGPETEVLLGNMKRWNSVEGKFWKKIQKHFAITADV